MPFDPNTYFVNRLQNTGTSKIESLAQAYREKVAALSQYQDEKSRIAAPVDPVNDSSWVNSLGLNPNSAVGEAVNLAASFGSGATRVAGQLASLPSNVMSLLDEAHLNDADVAAYTRYKQNIATPEDITRLSQVKATLNGTNVPKPGAPTTLQLFERAAEARKTGLGITEAMDTSKIVHQGKRDKLNKQLGENFDSAWEQTKQGASDLWSGELLTGGGNLVHGVARLIYNAGEAAVTNPAASAEYIAENIPQLVGGLAGKAGKAALTASNVGYGADLYQQGIKRYQEANDGALPPVEQRQKMAMHAAGAVLAEQGSDLIQLGAIKAAGKAAKEGTEAVTRTGFKESLKNSAKAMGEGIASEAPTEGYQTFAEGKATLKPASPLEIYQGTSIGGIAGGGLSGGGRAVAEVLGATPEKAAQRAQEQADINTFVENARTNNTADYLDRNSKSYNPAKAVAVHLANSQAVDTTPEARQQNVEKAHDIIAGLESERSDLQDKLDLMSPEGLQKRIDDLKARASNASPKHVAMINQVVSDLQKDLDNFDPKSVDPKTVKSLKTQIASLDRHIEESTKLRDELVVRTKPQEADVEAAVKSVETPTATTDPEAVTASKAAADHVVSLAMAHPDSFSDDHLNRLVASTNNGLSAAQRTYLRTLSQSRIAENALKTMSVVESEVMNGDPDKNQLGIKDYQQRMAAAITARNEEKAATALHMLGKFANGHTQKLRFVMEQFNNVGKGAVNIVPTQQGWALAPSQDTSKKGRAAIRELGGLTIHGGSTKLIRQIQAEVKALNAAHAQLKASYALRFQQPASVPPVAQTSVNQVGSTQAVDSGKPSQAQAAPQQVPVNQSNTASNQSTVDSTVDQKGASTRANAPVVTAKSIFRTLEESWQVQEASLGETNSAIEAGRKTEKEGAPLVAERDVLIAKKNRTLEDDLRISELDDLYMLIAIKNDPINELNDSILTWEEEKADLEKHPEDVGQDFATARIKAIDSLLVDARKFAQRAEALVNSKGSESLKELGYTQATQNESGYNTATPEVQAEVTAILTELNAQESNSNATTNPTNEPTQAIVGKDASQGKIPLQGSKQDSSENGQDKRESGKLSVFSKVVDTTGKALAEVFRTTNLIARNLVQKASKGGKTKRPLVAEKDFLSKWLDGTLDDKAIADFVGEELSPAQQGLLNHFRTTAKNWLPTITNNLVKGRVVEGKKLKQEIAAANKIKNVRDRKMALAKINAKIAAAEAGQVVFDPKFQYTNPIQYLIELNESGQADMEENIKTAIAAAAFMYVAENAKAPQPSSLDNVKAMFNLSAHDRIGDALYAKVVGLGSPERAVIISLGQRVVQALGLSARKDASKEFLPRLEADLGAHVMKLLVDQGILERTVVSRTDISAGLKHLEDHDPKKQGNMAFLRMKRTPGKRTRDRKLLPVADVISSMAKNTKGVMGKLFGVEAQVREPSLEPIKATQVTTANTEQEVPSELNKIIQHENSVANYVRKDMWTLLQGLGEDTFLELAGYVEPDESKMHKTTYTSTEVSNEALRRELTAAMEYFEYLGTDQAFYLPHSVWKQQRVGIDSTINPQSSKIHRWMITRADWKTTVDSKNTDSFMLRVAEGLGVKTDKQANPASLKAAKDLFDTKSADEETRKKAITLQKAVDALIDSRLPGVEMTQAHREAILAGVNAGREKMHSLDALIAMANYQKAKQNANGKPFTFEVQLMGEVDGVTNGPMLSHMALGAGASVEALMGRLNRGGFFEEGSGFQNYNVWRGEENHYDLYETTISAVINHINQQAEKAPVFARIQQITGTLYDNAKGKVEKAGRDIIKTPLTAMLFGSSVKGAVDSMFRAFIAKSYEGLEGIAELPQNEQETALREYIANLNNLLKESKLETEFIPFNTIEHFLTTFEFSESQEKALEKVFKDNLGKSVEAVMKQEFSSFLSIRDTLNQTADATFGLYNAAYQGIRRNVIQELIQSGDIAAGSKKIGDTLVQNAGDPLQDLTQEQEALIDARVAALNPVVHTYMSKLSKNGDKSGLHISKSSREFSKEQAYRNVSQFGNPLPEEGDGNSGSYSLRNVAYQRIMAFPGVAMVPMLIHSMDSAISHLALMGRQVLNIHDAHGTGLDGFIETAQSLNRATWKVLLNYSPAAELRDSFKNTLLGMDSLLKSGENLEAVIPEIQEYLKALGKKHGTWVDGVKQPMPMDQVLAYVAGNIFSTAYESDKTKYAAMAQMQYVDQYALEGGQYNVTEADRAEAQARLDAMGKNTVPRSVWNAIDRINEVVLGIQTNKAESPYGELGQSSIASDMDLVHLFEDKPLQNAGDVAKLIMGKLTPANQLLLRKALKLTGNDFPIQMLTSRTKDGAMGKQFNARGWFAYKEGKAAVYVLSPEFKASGLTPDLIVHELLHAALAKTINHPNTPEAKALVKSLEGLVGNVTAYLEAHPELKAKYGFKLDVHELVSWGMSDLGFQTEVLANVPGTKSSVSNKFMSAMMGFIKAISKFLGLPMTVKTADGQVVDNGLAVLIQEVSGLFEQAKNPENGKATGSHSSAMATIQNLSTLDVYDALNTQQVSPTFDDHLRGLLTDIVNKLHGPFGTFKAFVESKQATTPKDLWDQAKGKGLAPFGSKALAAGIPMNDQVAFVLEQVEATVQGALDANTGEAHDVLVELNKLYQEVRAKLENSTSLSPGLRDFLFQIESGAGNRTRHLAQFAALGLAHPEINAALKMGTARTSLVGSGSFAHRLEALFQKVLEWFNGRLTHTFAGQPADEKLSALVRQLVEIEAKRKAPMLQKASAGEFIEDTLKRGSASLKNKAEQLGNSKWIRDRKNSIVRASGAVLSTVAGERTEEVMNHIQSIRDRQTNKGFGLAMGIVNEIRGMNDGNKMFHRLIREAKLREGIREDLITHTSNVVLESFANQGKDLSQKDKEALSAGLLRTDIAALLDHHTMAEITELLSNPVALDREITRLEGLLAPYRKARGFQERYAKNLGYKMATGQVKGHHFLMNAANIARLVGTGNENFITETDAVIATPIIDQLASLYAYRYTDNKHKYLLKNILQTEAARGNANGVEMVLKLHKSLQEQSRERLFEGSEALMMKGYTPEIYDPKKEAVVATEQEGAKLEAQGYIPGKLVSSDPLDPDKADRYVYKRDGGGLRPWLSTIFSYTGEAAKGSRSKTDNVKNLAEWTANKQDLRRMAAHKQTAVQREFRYDPSYDPSEVEDNFAAPVLNAQGKVTDYRYLMQEKNKDDLLNRDNRFDKILGFFAGNIYDKESTKENNRKAVQALFDQYNEDFVTRSESYRKVGPDSADAELRDIYRMLPDDTKKAIKEIWGTDYMMVRSDLMDINFGYRKVSLTDAFHKEHKNVADRLFTGLMTHTMGEKAEYNLRRAEDIWQEIVAEAKEILVIKNLSTLLGNIGSNISLLYWYGVPLKDMARYHRIALKGVSTYRQDSAALIELETQLAAGYIMTSKREMEHEIARLKDAIARNPVKELIDAGLMPSIVEDVSLDDDMYSYKSRLVNFTGEHTQWVNKHVAGAARAVYMAKDTKMYKALHHATQLSDFVARYALYAHVTTRQDNPMNKEDAAQLASDSFVNYDLPSHRKLQYMNDMGFVQFTKYYLRIQKVIARLYAENPGRAMALLVTEHFFSAAPMVTDSGFVQKLGNNPFEPGAFNYLGALDELATIKWVKSVL